MNTRYFLTVIAGAFSAVALAVIFPSLIPVHAPVQEVLGAPETQVTFQKNLIPITDSTYTLGTTSKTWLNLYTDEICLAGDCQTAWPAGSGSGDGVSNWLFDGTNLTPSTTPVGIVVNGTSTMAGIQASYGTVSFPAYSFTGDPDTGIYRNTTNTLDFASGGTRKLSIGSGVEVKNNIDLFNSSSGSFYLEGALGSVSAPTYSFVSDQDTGMWQSPADNLNFSTGGIERFRVNSSGFGIGTTSPSRLLTVQGGDAWIGGNLTATGTLTVTPLTSALTLTGADGAFAEYAGTSCTNQFVRSLSALGVATCATVDISADTNLSADGTEIVLTGDALSLGNSLSFTYGSTTAITSSGNAWLTYASSTAQTMTRLWNTYASTTGISGTNLSFTNAVISTLATFLNVTVTGLLDIGGGVIEIPNGTEPTVDSVGEIAVDSTSDQFVYYGASKKVLGNGNFYPAFTYATTTAWTGTTTIPLGTAYVAETWNGVQCFTDTGTLVTRFGDSTNWTNVNNSSTTVGTTVFTTNNTFTAGEKRYVEVGTPASSPTKISCTISKSLTAD